MGASRYVSSKGAVVLAASFALALALFGCGSKPAEKDVVVDSGSGTQTQTDEMFNKRADGAELYVFQFDGRTKTVKDFYEVSAASAEPLRDGGFYRLVADVNYLNGGVAGYVDYPEIRSVRSCTEVSPLDIGLPTISEQPYGLTLIGDYADGDVLLNSQTTMAVWKDGDWAYVYDKTIKLPDGRTAGVRKGVTEADVQAGIENGVLSCPEYFVVPS